MNIDQMQLFKKVKSNITETSLGDEIILLHLEDGKYHCMNATASLLWDWLDEPMSAFSLHQQLVSTLGYYPIQAGRDIIQWLESTLENKLLEPLYDQNTEQLIRASSYTPVKRVKMTSYSSPQTTLFDVLTLTQGSSTDFQTDNLETGS